MQFDRLTLREKVTSIDLGITRKLDELDFDFLFNYKIFPCTIMTYMTQWQAEKRKMKTGDTILQQVFIPPLPRFSAKIIFGVRINSIIQENMKRGFSYETLEGHVEKGESIFTVEQIDGKVIFKIQSFSTPGSALTKRTAPFFSLPFQTYCTRKALENVKRQVS